MKLVEFSESNAAKVVSAVISKDFKLLLKVSRFFITYKDEILTLLDAIRLHSFLHTVGYEDEPYNVLTVTIEEALQTSALMGSHTVISKELAERIASVLKDRFEPESKSLYEVIQNQLDTPYRVINAGEYHRLVARFGSLNFVDPKPEFESIGNDLYKIQENFHD